MIVPCTKKFTNLKVKFQSYLNIDEDIIKSKLTDYMILINIQMNKIDYTIRNNPSLYHDWLKSLN